jgi:hypothetical protein
MKILIISTGRSGSTNLSLGLSESLEECDLFFEPFAPFGHNNNKLIRNDLGTITSRKKHLFYLKNSNYNIVEKHIIDDPWFWGNKEEPIKDYCINFYIEYCKLFDRVILLDRRDIKEWAISWKNASNNNDFFNYSKKNYDNINIEKEIHNLYPLKEIIHNLSSILNFPIYYYEDIFSSKEENIQKIKVI